MYGKECIVPRDGRYRIFSAPSPFEGRRCSYVVRGDVAALRNRGYLKTKQEVDTMRKSNLAFVVILLSVVCVLSSAQAQSPEELIYMTEHFPPFNMRENGEATGITVDILEEIFQRLDVDAEIELLPWAQGYRRIQEEPKTVLFGMARTEAREELFQWVGPIMPFRTELVSLEEKDLSIEGYEDLHAYRIGTVRDDVTEETLLAEGVPLANLDRSSELASNLRQLMAGRIDMIAYPTAVVLWEAGELGYDRDLFTSFFLMEELKLYYAFHRDMSEDVIEKFQTALDALHEEGIVEDIIAGYLE